MANALKVNPAPYQKDYKIIPGLCFAKIGSK
jgi:hypothetical protein